MSNDPLLSMLQVPKRAMVIAELLEHCRKTCSAKEKYNWSEHIREKWRNRVDVLAEILEETLTEIKP